MFTANQVEYTVYEVNRIVQVLLNDPMPGVPWASESDHIQGSVADGVRYAMELVADGDLTEEQRARLMHENWLRFKRADGWTYGPVKDPIGKKHPLIVDYDRLPAVEKVKEFMTLSVVRVLTQHAEG